MLGSPREGEAAATAPAGHSCPAPHAPGAARARGRAARTQGTTHAQRQSRAGCPAAADRANRPASSGAGCRRPHPSAATGLTLICSPLLRTRRSRQAAEGATPTAAATAPEAREAPGSRRRLAGRGACSHNAAHGASLKRDHDGGGAGAPRSDRSAGERGQSSDGENAGPREPQGLWDSSWLYRVRPAGLRVGGGEGPWDEP